MEMPSYNIERSYRVRIFSRTFNERKLARIRAGCIMRGRRYGPYVVEIITRQNTNTWLHIKLYTGKNNEIRKVMRKFSCTVSRLKRVSYGPYSLEKYVPNPNDLQEVPITKEIRKLMYNYYRGRSF